MLFSKNELTSFLKLWTCSRWTNLITTFLFLIYMENSIKANSLRGGFAQTVRQQLKAEPAFIKRSVVKGFNKSLLKPKPKVRVLA